MRWLVVAMLLVGCGKPSLVSTGSGYATAERLDFERVWVGFPHEQRLEILSRARSSQSLPVVVRAPGGAFVAAADVVELNGGDTVELVVRFAPLTAGAVHGTLTVGELEVALAGEGALPPACPPPLGCRRSAFDPVVGGCVEQVEPDGASCEAGACLEDGRCRAGECVGVARRCDDGNACTRDSCAPEVGCQHADVSAQCPGAPDACHAAACDAQLGCTIAPVADGTACGLVSCALANVCMQGRCVALTPPDGFPCSPSSPCQDRGVCRAQACVQPAPRLLAPAWTWTPAADARLVFDGVSDPSGNLWWVECVQGVLPACQPVSRTKDGFERVRGVPVAGLSGERLAQLYDEGRFVFAGTNGVVTAVDGPTGVEQWRAELLPLLTGRTDLAELHSIQLTSDGRGHLWVSAEPGIERCGTELTLGERSIVQLDAATGAVRLSSLLAHRGRPVVDEQGNLFVYRLEDPLNPIWSPQLVSLTPQGAQRFVADGGAEPAAVASGQLVTQANRVFASGSGVELAPFASYDLSSDEVLQVGGQTIRLRDEMTCFPTNPPMVPSELVVFDAAAPGGKAISYLAGSAGEVTMPVMAQQSTVLVAGRPGAGALRLLGVTTAGAQRFSCDLSEPVYRNSFQRKVAFTGDRFAVVYHLLCRGCLPAPPVELRVYDTTGLGVATSGWVAPRGTPGNAGRAR